MTPAAEYALRGDNLTWLVLSIALSWPLLWVSVFRLADRPRWVRRTSMAVTAGVSSVLVFAPAVWWSVYEQGPTDNPGAGGILFGLLYFGVPIAFAATLFGLLCAGVVALVLRLRTPGPPDLVLLRRVVVFAALALSIPVLPYALVVAVGLMMTG